MRLAKLLLISISVVGIFAALVASKVRSADKLYFTGLTGLCTRTVFGLTTTRQFTTVAPLGTTSLATTPGLCTTITAFYTGL